MNKGLNGKSVYQSFSVGNAGDIYLNVNRNEAGVFIKIPLFVTPGYFSLPFNLCFSSFNLTQNDKFGYGVREELFKNFILEGNNLTVTDAFGKNIIHTKASVNNDGETIFENLENKNIIILNSSHYIIKDLNGNSVSYKIGECIPSSIISKTQELLTTSSREEYTDFGGTTVDISSNGSLFTNIIFKKEIYSVIEELYKIQIEYSNNTIRKIKHYKKENSVYKLLFTNEYYFSSSQIKIVDGMTGYYVECIGDTVGNTFITKHINEGYSNIENARAININYPEGDLNITRVFQTINNVVHFTDYQFNSNNLLKRVFNNNSLCSVYEYDTSDNLISKSRLFSNTYQSNKMNSLLCDYFAEDDVNTWTSNLGTNAIKEINITNYAELFGNVSMVIDNVNGSTVYFKELSAEGYIGDIYTLKIWSMTKANSGSLNVKIIFSKGTKVQENSFDIQNDSIDVNLFEVKTEIEYNNIKIEMSVAKDDQQYISSITLEKTHSLIKNEYDNNKNLIKQTYGQLVSEYQYNPESNLIEEILNLDKTIKYQRNEDQYISSIRHSHGLIETISYNSNYIPKEKRLSVDNKYMMSTEEYYNNYLIKSVDVNNIETNFAVDEKTGLVEKITNNYNIKTIEQNFTYNEYSDVTSAELDNKVITYDNSYIMNNENQYINKINAVEKLDYIYYYDQFNRLIKIAIKDNESSEKEIIEYSYYSIDGYPTNNIEYIKKYGKLVFKFVYDDINIDNIKQVYEINNNTETLLVEYSYDIFGNVSSYTYDGNPVSYKYDLQNMLIEYSKNGENSNESIIEKYQYGLKNQLVEKELIFNNEHDYYVYESKDDSSAFSLEAIYNEYYNRENIYITFFDDYMNTNDNISKLYYRNNNQLSYKTGAAINVGFSYANRIHIADFTNSGEKQVSYYVENNYDLIVFPSYITAGIWFKPTANGNYCICNLKNFNLINARINLETNYNATVSITIVANDNSEHKIYSTNTVNINSWNYVGISLKQENGELSIIFQLNDVSTESVISGNVISLSHIDFITIGSLSGADNRKSFMGYIGNFIYSNEVAYTANEINDYYKNTGKYLYYNEGLLNLENVSFSSTTRIQHKSLLNSGGDLKGVVYPLNQTLNSIDGAKPYLFEKKSLLKYDKYRIYKYNEALGHSAYIADGSKLVYNSNMSTSGIVLQKILFEDKKDTQTIVEIYESSIRRIMVYRGYGNQIYVTLHNQTFCSNIVVNDNNWSNILISWYSSTGTTPKTHLKLIIDGNQYLCNYDRVFTSNVKVSVGREYANSIINPMYGLISTLVLNNGYYFSSGEVYGNYLKTNTYTKEFDEYNLLKKRKVTVNIDNIYTIDYNYKEISNDDDTEKGIKRITSQISNETHRYGTTENKIAYRYDDLGRIQHVDNYVNGSHMSYEGYTYSAESNLLTEVSLSLAEYRSYTYDNLGNRLSYKVISTNNNTILKDISYVYGDFNKLEKAGDLEIKYDEELCPREFGKTVDGTFVKELSLTWEDNRLTKYKDELNNKEYLYTYDKLTKQRVSKTVDSVKTNYLYSNGLLIYESSGSDYKKYIYDENGTLVELECKVGSNTYQLIYERDITGKILGLINYSGEKVIGYVYSAFGEILKITGSLKDSALKINPILYKGYYYDVETQLYWVSSRYYSPELCRWISPDSIEYLDPQSINGLNLYAYCGNDPINKYDPTGHSAIALLIAFGIGAVLGGIYGGVSAAANGQNVWKGIAIGAVVGGLTGLITEVASVPLMLLGTFAVGAGGDIASQMILDEKSFGEVNLISAAWAGVANAGLALVGKGLSIVDKMAGLTTAESIIFGTMTNSPLLGLGMAINMGISKHASVYTVNDLYNDTFGKYKQLTWRW